MTNAAVTRITAAFLHINLLGRSTMPTGVYQRKPRLSYRGKPLMTADEKAESQRVRSALYRASNKAKTAAYWAANKTKNTPRRAAYYTENRDKIKAKSSAYYTANKARCAVKHAAYQKANAEKLAVHQAERRAAIPERIVESSAAYYAANREKVSNKNAAYSKAHPDVGRKARNKRRAFKSGASIVDVDLITAWEAKWRSRKTIKCHWCGKRILTTDAHVDHILPLSKGGEHSVDNLCVSCPNCNLSKHAKLPAVWNKTLRQPLLFL